MTTQSIKSKLETNGYSITVTMNGTYIAKRNQSSYTANSLTGLYKAIFN
jgi:hypothetical protein